MALNDFQWSLQGLTFGAGTAYVLEDVTGMGVGPKDDKKYAIGGAAGYRWGREYRRGNLLVFEGLITTPGDPAAAYNAVRALRTAFRATGVLNAPDGSTALGYKMPGQAETSVDGRPQACEVSLAKLALGIAPFQATFECRAGVTV